jgi:hypothetical protein
MIQVLYTSAKIRAAIQTLFSLSHGRRIAISAFVGKGCQAFLPKLKGLRLICWPRAGGTNPDEIRSLRKKGVLVEFADKVHMKVYWTEDKGAIITSANLSTNAFGWGDLKEVGVLLPSPEVDINKIIGRLKPRAVTPSELSRLDREHDIYIARHQSEIDIRRKASSFQDWSNDWAKSLSPREWKLGWWDSDLDFPKAAKEVVWSDYRRKPHDYVSGSHGDYSLGDWILTFRLTGLAVTDLAWLYAEYIVPITISDACYDQRFPIAAVQAWPTGKSYETPPFRVHEKKFGRAFDKAIRGFGAGKIKNQASVVPTQQFIGLIRKFYDE